MQSLNNEIAELRNYDDKAKTLPTLSPELVAYCREKLYFNSYEENRMKRIDEENARNNPDFFEEESGQRVGAINLLIVTPVTIKRILKRWDTFEMRIKAPLNEVDVLNGIDALGKDMLSVPTEVLCIHSIRTNDSLTPYEKDFVLNCIENEWDKMSVKQQEFLRRLNQVILNKEFDIKMGEIPSMVVVSRAIDKGILKGFQKDFMLGIQKIKTRMGMAFSFDDHISAKQKAVLSKIIPKLITNKAKLI